uniref:NADH-ubiquinone oxidoreductase chain 5 n=1 Tax=Taeniogonalos taihorina TaxID=1515605 RepID=A0A0K0KBJ6_9HYME|nr:NADH dehydrogenase subunit 5 [Taeniogonalos taihorina]AIE11791.1 NADH dehydrogenase subunit 5 [Taeniogonalos taihorina]
MFLMNKFKYILGMKSLTFFFFSMYMYMNKIIFIYSWQFMTFNSKKITYSLFIDWMTLIFMKTVLLISSMIMIYSYSYMKHENMKNMFIYIMILFILSMIMMIISPNLMSIILGWDGLGLTSFCLILFYNTHNSLNSSLLTILSNRLGDIFILMTIALLMSIGSWNQFLYSNKFIMSMFLILTAMTKSAQFPFSSWLPAAMAAPTPVSSLVHSSTLVTAGIYLMIRYNSIFKLNMIKMILMYSAIITLFMSSMMANMENDLKKIIALSTLSQLSIMMISLTSNMKMLAFFHLITHAMFKSLLFMCSGSMIHNFSSCQNIRNLGNLIKMTPFTSSCFLIANISLCGFMFTSGFFSKDLIIEMISISKINFIPMIMMIFSIGLTMSYSTRLINLTLLNKSNLKNYLTKNFFCMKMNFSLICLTILSSILGYNLFNMFFITQSLPIIPIKFKMILIMNMIFGWLMGNFLYNNFYKNKKMYMFIMYFFMLNKIVNKINILMSNFIKNSFNNEKKIYELLTYKELFVSIKNSYKFKNKINWYKLYILMTLISMMILYLMNY